MAGAAASCLLTGHFCEQESLVVGNDGDPGLDAEGEVEAGADATGDGSPATESGPVTLVVSTMEVLDERLCDLDGDGNADNSVADLGSPGAALFATALSSIVGGFDVDSISRMLLHLPWIEDLSTPSDPGATLFFLRSEDVDQPSDPSDDLSGEEAFYFVADSLSGCGEPIHQAGPFAIEDGRLPDVAGTVATTLAHQLVTLTGRIVEGRLQPGGASAVATMCVYPDIEELGATRSGILGGRTALEALLVGGATFGLVGIPGLSPDVDLDGDGLERFELDDDGRISSCVDGDLTVIEGPDCWQDSRIVDSFSLVVHLDAVRAVLAGPSPTWWSTRGARCEDLSDGAAAWGPCAAGACERWSTDSCMSDCGDEGSRRCLWDCSGFSACRPSSTATFAFDECDAVELHAATCDGAPPVARLADAPGETAGFRLRQEVVVGRGPVSIEAHVSASLGTSEEPAFGWAIAAYVDDAVEWLGQGGARVGVDWARRGWSLEWHFFRTFDAVVEEYDRADDLVLQSLVGEVSPADFVRFRHFGLRVQPALDAASTGTAAQALRLVIEPDLPETPENELVVSGSVLDEEGSSVLSVGCFGDNCPAASRVRVGDTLQVGVTSATDSTDDARMELLAEEGGFTVEVAGLCAE